jgi:hypothetical protein
MSLLRLLTAGKSLIGVQQATGRYRLPDPRSMPKFGDGKIKTRPAKVESEARPAGGTAEQMNRAAAIAVAEKLETELTVSAAAPAPARASEPRQAMAEMAGPAEARTQEPQTEKSPEAVSTSPGAETKTPGKRSGNGWISKLSSLKKIWQRNEARASKPRPELRPVQGELSLDKIKVVRNDLSESDLEVVPLRSRRGGKEKSAETVDGAREKVGLEKGLALTGSERS